MRALDFGTLVSSGFKLVSYVAIISDLYKQIIKASNFELLTQEKRNLKSEYLLNISQLILYQRCAMEKRSEDLILTY